MIPRKRLDIGWRDVLYGIGSCLLADSESAERKLCQAWPGGDKALACLSVRSGFDALLQVLDFPAGSEILVSAVTIRDMTRIIQAHGLVPVPIDLDVQQLAVRPESMERAVTSRTRAILVAHLFGSRMAMEPVLAFAKEHGLAVFEDCAQAYAGPEDLCAPRADVSMFSFGTIKTATALGGGIFCFRDPDLLERARRHQEQWPIRSRWHFLSRLLKYSLLMLLSYRPVYSLFIALCRLLGIDHDRLIGERVRGFPGDDLLQQIRHRPSAPLLSLLARRIRRFDQETIAQRTALARLATERMPSILRPGAQAEDHTHWIFPILHDCPEDLQRFLWRKGFDATRGATSLCVVDPPADRPEMEPLEARQAFQRLLYFPVYAGLSRRCIERLAAAVQRFELPLRDRVEPVMELEVSAPPDPEDMIRVELPVFHIDVDELPHGGQISHPRLGALPHHEVEAGVPETLAGGMEQEGAIGPDLRP
jgi:dTDP-4-amino-4,6-dideoxygalactose transaminase